MATSKKKARFIEMHKWHRHKDFDRIKWVVEVTAGQGDEWTRIIWNRVLFHNGLCVATNGHALHACLLTIPEDFQDGVYRIIAKKAGYLFLVEETQMVEDYPDWCGVLFQKDQKWIFQVLLAGREYTRSQNYARVIRLMNEKAALRFKYFSLAARMTDNVYVPVKDAFPLMFCSDTSMTLAMIMPMMAR